MKVICNLKSEIIMLTLDTSLITNQKYQKNTYKIDLKVKNKKASKGYEFFITFTVILFSK